MKLCCKEKSVSPKDVLSLMKCELSNSKLTRDAEDPANRKSDTRGLDGKDENEITTAVSNVNVLKRFVFLPDASDRNILHFISLKY